METYLQQGPVPSPWEQKHEHLFRRLTWLFLAVGVLWRSVRYLLCFPIWGDEASLTLNFVGNDYYGLTQSLHHGQVAPLFFLWGELTVYRLLGSSELAMRLLPYLAGLGSLLLFTRLAWVTLTPLARTMAVGFLAVSIWPVSMGALVKPYAFDLFTSALLITLAVEWLRCPERLRWLVLLAGLTPVALLFSYPVVFVAGAISIALLHPIWRGGWKPRSIYLVFNLLMVGAFAGHYLLVSANHLNTPINGTTTEVGMDVYWKDAFPPRSVGPLIPWLLDAHTGQAFAHPLGASKGGSVLTTFLVLAGVWWFRRLGSLRPHTGATGLLLICLVPLGLNLIAAFLRKYPYCASGRLSQHFAPGIILLAGAGLSGLLHTWIHREEVRLRWATVWAAALALIGVVGAVRDVATPYRARHDVAIRQTCHEIHQVVGPDRTLVVGQPRGTVDSVVAWYLERHHPKIVWIDPAASTLSLDPDRHVLLRWELTHTTHVPPFSVTTNQSTEPELREVVRYHHPVRAFNGCTVMSYRLFEPDGRLAIQSNRGPGF